METQPTGYEPLLKGHAFRVRVYIVDNALQEKRLADVVLLDDADGFLGKNGG